MKASQATVLTSAPRAREGWLAGFIAILLLSTAAFWNYTPPLAGTQALRVVFAEPRPGTREPLIVSGEKGHGDFFFVAFPDARTLALGYDRWGSGGPLSAPIAFEPGKSYAFEVELPSLPSVIGNPHQPAAPRLRVAFEGRTLLDQPAEPVQRRATRLWFGENPLGGSSCGERFQGKIFAADGSPRAGAVREALGRGARFTGWLWFGRAQVVFILLVGTGAGWGWLRLRRARIDGRSTVALQNVARGLRAHASFALTALLCTGIFAAVLTGFSGRFVYPDVFGNFYDYQALSLLDGRLDVPDEAIGGEAFVHRGKRYGYFGPTPALLRLPLVVFGAGFGQLTRPLMLAGFVASLLAAYLVLLEVRRLLPGAAAPPRPWIASLFTLNLGLGSTLLFLGSRAYVYHEAILWGIAFALWATWCALRFRRAPASRWWLGALGCGVLSVHARPPTGLFALTLLGCVAAAFAWRASTGRLRALAIGAAAVAGVLSYNGLSYLKFETIDGCPLRLNVQYTAKRLARIDGKQFHAANIPFTAYSYLVAPNLLPEPKFPWLFLNVTKPLPRFPAAKMDASERTLALPYAMTGLSLLALAGMGAVARRNPGGLRPVAALAWCAVLPMAFAMFAAIAVDHRYTGDFVPFLILAAACGAGALETTTRRARVVGATLLAAATLWAVALNLAITLHYQGEQVWGAPPEFRDRYRALCRTIDAWIRDGQEDRGE